MEEEGKLYRQGLHSDQVEGNHFLNQLDLILASDPLIDEVGFVHPSQFATLRSEEEEEEESGLSSETSDVAEVSAKPVNASFWCEDHKLGISTDVVLPLYKAAKPAFMAAMRDYNASDDSSISSYSEIESEVMKRSKSLLLLSSDFGTAWHSRKLIVSKKHPVSEYMNELHLSALLLSYAPKCEHAWSHRRWVIKSIARRCSTLQEILGRESELVEKIAERSKMNYRAWNHRCWLVSYMSIEQALYELKKSRKWASLHVADNSCFHFRRRLMLRVLESSSKEPETAGSELTVDVHALWKDELEWNESLIKLYVGREALWLHRRFLAIVLMTRLSNNHTEISSNTDIATFLNNELNLLSSCSTVSDSEFEDHEAQAIHSATYMFWLAKQAPEFHGIGFLKKLRCQNLINLLNKTCPEKSFLWDHLADHSEKQI